MTQKFSVPDDDDEMMEVNIDPTNWPSDLAGIRVGNDNFFIEGGIVKIVGYPIWRLGDGDGS